MNELDRFKKKATPYRQALEEHPAARLLEIYPILWYLEKHRKSIGKTRKSLRIVDLMSGSGFLSGNLSRLGFKDLHAIEFCEEMHKDATAYHSKVRLHCLSSFDHLDSALDSIKPDVILSLASFHHLIVYENNNINKGESTNLQSRVVDICMRSLPDNGILLISDLMEDDVTETPIEPFKNSMADIAKCINELGLNTSVTEKLKAANSLHGASSLLHREFCVKSGNNSLRWFRDIVDNKTSVGHKDIALSDEFVQKVSSYRPIITKYTCPWLFESETSLADFVYKKFAFILDSNSLTKEEVQELARNNLGVRNNNNTSALGWNLGVILLGKLEPFSKDRRFYKYLNSLIFMIVVLVISIILRQFAGIYEEIGPKDLVVFLLTLPIGIILGDLINTRSITEK